MLQRILCIDFSRAKGLQSPLFLEICEGLAETGFQLLHNLEPVQNGILGGVGVVVAAHSSSMKVTMLIEGAGVAVRVAHLEKDSGGLRVTGAFEQSMKEPSGESATPMGGGDRDVLKLPLRSRGLCNEETEDVGRLLDYQYKSRRGGEKLRILAG